VELYLHSHITSSWHGAELSAGYLFMAWYLVQHRDTFTFIYSINLKILKVHHGYLGLVHAGYIQYRVAVGQISLLSISELRMFNKIQG